MYRDAELDEQIFQKLYDLEDSMEAYEQLADRYFTHNDCRNLPYKFQYNYVETCQSVGVNQYTKCCNTVIPCMNVPGHIYDAKTGKCDVKTMSVNQCY